MPTLAEILQREGPMARGFGSTVPLVRPGQVPPLEMSARQAPFSENLRGRVGEILSGTFGTSPRAGFAAADQLVTGAEFTPLAVPLGLGDVATDPNRSVFMDAPEFFMGAMPGTGLVPRFVNKGMNLGLAKQTEALVKAGLRGDERSQELAEQLARATDRSLDARAQGLPESAVGAAEREARSISEILQGSLPGSQTVVDLPNAQRVSNEGAEGVARILRTISPQPNVRAVEPAVEQFDRVGREFDRLNTSLLPELRRNRNQTFNRTGRMPSSNDKLEELDRIFDAVDMPVEETHILMDSIVRNMPPGGVFTDPDRQFETFEDLVTFVLETQEEVLDPILRDKIETVILAFDDL